MVWSEAMHQLILKEVAADGVLWINRDQVKRTGKSLPDTYYIPLMCTACLEDLHGALL